MDFRVTIQSITARYKETASDQKWRWGSLASSLCHKPVPLSFPCGKISSHLDDSPIAQLGKMVGGLGSFLPSFSLQWVSHLT